MFSSFYKGFEAVLWVGARGLTTNSIRNREGYTMKKKVKARARNAYTVNMALSILEALSKRENIAPVGHLLKRHSYFLIKI